MQKDKSEKIKVLRQRRKTLNSMPNAFLIKKPWVTEKSSIFTKMGKYVFIVESSATKQEVKKAIKRLYKADVVRVNIVNRPAKAKRVGARRGYQPGYKKAVVTLKMGQTIDLR